MKFGNRWEKEEIEGKRGKEEIGGKEGNRCEKKK